MRVAASAWWRRGARGGVTAAAGQVAGGPPGGEWVKTDAGDQKAGEVREYLMTLPRAP